MQLTCHSQDSVDVQLMFLVSPVKQLLLVKLTLKGVFFSFLFFSFFFFSFFLSSVSFLSSLLFSSFLFPIVFVIVFFVDQLVVVDALHC